MRFIREVFGNVLWSNGGQLEQKEHEDIFTHEQFHQDQDTQPVQVTSLEVLQKSHESHQNDSRWKETGNETLRRKIEKKGKKTTLINTQQS